MSEDETSYEGAVKRREAVLAEAARMYREDIAVRRICDSVVAEALETIETRDQGVAADAITNAVMRAIAMVAGKGSDSNFIMAERDMYRERLLETARLTPGIPIHPTALAEKGIPGLAEIQDDQA